MFTLAKLECSVEKFYCLLKKSCKIDVFPYQGEQYAATRNIWIPFRLWWFSQHSCLGSLVAGDWTSTSDKCVSTSVITARIKCGDLKKGMTGNHEWKRKILSSHYFGRILSKKLQANQEFTLKFKILPFLLIFSNKDPTSDSGNFSCSLPDLPCQAWRALEVAPR